MIDVPKSLRRLDAAVIELRGANFGIDVHRKRALLLAEGMVREARRRSWTVSVFDPRRDNIRYEHNHRSARLVFETTQGGAGFWFSEPRLRSETPAGRGAPPVDCHSAVDRLVIRARHVRLRSNVREWGDRPRRSLEQSLGAIFDWIERNDARHVLEQAEFALRRAEWQRQWDEEREQERLDQEAQKRRDDLVADARRWRQARDVREYLAAVRAQMAAEPDAAQIAEAEEWLAESKRIADRLDPFSATHRPWTS